MTQRRLLVVGELCVDLILLAGDRPRFGQHEQLIDSTTLTMGSSSAITACGAARLGVPTTLVAVLGDDEFGRFLLEQLERRGVSTTALRVDPDTPTGASTHLSLPDGDRAILTSLGSIGATRASDVSESLLRETAHLHVGSYFLQTALHGDVPALFASARRAGLTTSLDGNFDPAELWDSGILDVLPEVDVLFGNELELCGIAGLADPEEARLRLLASMPSGAIVVLKLGSAGASASSLVDGGLVEWRAGIPPLDGGLVDTVGAGDSLAAGFIAARLAGADVGDALALAVACGSMSTRAAGGVDGQPDRSAAARLAERVPVTVPAQ